MINNKLSIEIFSLLFFSKNTNLLERIKKKYEIEINKNVLKLLKENRLEELIDKDKVSKNIPEYNGSFSQAYRKAVRDLGSSKDNYFIWRGNVYSQITCKRRKSCQAQIIVFFFIHRIFIRANIDT